MYHISDRDEGLEAEPDERGSRAYPSRTSFGEAWAIGEKHPNLMRARSFVFGLVTVPMYEYRCVLTCAQIELLAIDKPLVNYGTGIGKKGKKGKKGDRSGRRPSKAEVDRVTDAWMEKYKDGKKPVIDLSGFIIKKK